MRTPDAEHPPPCRGSHDMFDSTHPTDAYEARLVCRRCPYRMWCEQQLMAAHLAGWHPTGTWAGQLLPRHRPPTANLNSNGSGDTRIT